MSITRLSPKLHSLMTLVSPRSSKCYISISNGPIAFKLNTEVKYLKLHRTNVWSDCSKILHRGAVSIEEYIHKVNMAHIVKSGQLRADKGPNKGNLA